MVENVMSQGYTLRPPGVDVMQMQYFTKFFMTVVLFDSIPAAPATTEDNIECMVCR